MLWIDLGSAALYVGVAIGLLNLLFFALGTAFRDEAFLKAGRRGVYLLALVISLSIGALAYGFLSEKCYDVIFVGAHSDASTQWFFQIAGVWAGQEGSLLFWTWILSIIAAIFVFSSRKHRDATAPWALTMLALVQVAFLGLTSFMEQNPFHTYTDEALSGYIASTTDGMAVQAGEGQHTWRGSATGDDLLFWLRTTHAGGYFEEGPSYAELSLQLEAVQHQLDHGDAGPLGGDAGLPGPELLLTHIIDSAKAQGLGLRAGSGVAENLNEWDSRDLLGLVGHAIRNQVTVTPQGGLAWRPGFSRPTVAAWLAQEATVQIVSPGVPYAELVPPTVLAGLQQPQIRDHVLREAPPAFLATITPPTLFPRMIEKAHDLGYALVPDGNGINPLLANYWIAIHPPNMYTGFILASVPFALALAALLSGQVGAGWVRRARPWVLASWGFLTIGNVLGGVWAYEELGWGGFWAWDPVENAAILPWFTTSALLHAMMIQERRGIFKAWTISLAVVTFCLTLLGTWITRSGEIRSVHAFAEGTLIGGVLLAFVIVFGIGSAALIAYRWRDMKAARRIDSLMTREAMFLFGTLVLLLIGLLTLTLTLWPLIDDVASGTPSDTSKMFWINTPFFLALLLIMGIGMALSWRKLPRGTVWERLRLPTVLFVAGMAVAFTMQALWSDISWDNLDAKTAAMAVPTEPGGEPAMGTTGLLAQIKPLIWPLIGPLVVGLSLAVIAVHLGGVKRTIQPIMQRWRGAPDNPNLTPTWARDTAKNGSSLALGFKASLHALSRERRRVAAYLVHGGLVLLFVGIAFESLYKTTREGVVVTLGDSFVVETDFPTPSNLRFTFTKYELGCRVDPEAPRFAQQDTLNVSGRLTLKDSRDAVQLLPDGTMPLAYFERTGRSEEQESASFWQQQLRRIFPVNPTVDADRFFFEGSLQTFNSWYQRRPHDYDYTRAWIEVRRAPPVITLSPETLPAGTQRLLLSTDLGSEHVEFTGDLTALGAELARISPALGITCDRSATDESVAVFPTRADGLTVRAEDGAWETTVPRVEPDFILTPEMRSYYRGQRPTNTAEVSVHRSLFADEFLIMQEYMGASRLPGQTIFTFHHNPMIAWLWVAFIIMVVGTAVGMLPLPRKGTATAGSDDSSEEVSAS